MLSKVASDIWMNPPEIYLKNSLNRRYAITPSVVSSTASDFIYSQYVRLFFISGGILPGKYRCSVYTTRHLTSTVHLFAYSFELSV
jgi:hypothetical protein